VILTVMGADQRAAHLFPHEHAGGATHELNRDGNLGGNPPDRACAEPLRADPPCRTLRAEREVRDATHLASDPGEGEYRRSGQGWPVCRLRAS
jgi:hypothetical protein